MFLHLAETLKHRFPDAKPDIDYRLQDDADGNGPYIKEWSLLDPKPTIEELKEVWEGIKEVPPPLSEVEQLKKQVADLGFLLMINGVI